MGQALGQLHTEGWQHGPHLTYGDIPQRGQDVSALIASVGLEAAALHLWHTPGQPFFHGYFFDHLIRLLYFLSAFGPLYPNGF